MSDKTKIEWSDSTWTPIRARVRKDAAEIAKSKGYTSLVEIAAKQAGHVGAQCERCSEGCDHCYSETFQARCLPHNGTGLPFDRRSRDLVEYFLDEKVLLQPLKWKKPRKVFVCSQTDLFGEWVPDEWIDRIFAVMALCPHVTFQVLTKRAERMASYFASRPAIYSEYNVQNVAPDYLIRRLEDTGILYGTVHHGRRVGRMDWPLPNVHLGVSVENQEQADKRIPHLLRTPAAVRFLSCEPLLGELDIYQYLGGERNPIGPTYGGKGVDWVIAGSESGPGARPAREEWFRSIKDQCVASGVPIFLKQYADSKGHKIPTPMLDGQQWMEFPEARS